MAMAMRAVLDALRGLGAHVESRHRDIQLVVGDVLRRRVGGRTAERGDAADRRVGLQRGADQARFWPWSPVAARSA